MPVVTAWLNLQLSSRVSIVLHKTQGANAKFIRQTSKADHHKSTVGGCSVRQGRDKSSQLADSPERIHSSRAEQGVVVDFLDGIGNFLMSGTVNLTQKLHTMLTCVMQIWNYVIHSAFIKGWAGKLLDLSINYHAYLSSFRY